MDHHHLALAGYSLLPDAGLRFTSRASSTHHIRQWRWTQARDEKRSLPHWLGLLTVWLLTQNFGIGARAAERPNIVIIMSDDMGYSDIGCYGGEIQTPNLDGLASGGVRFTQFYNTARCCPTRASLLTGLYPHQAGVGHMMTDHGEKFPGYRGDLQPNCRTIAQVLKSAGYRSYAIGKWHVTHHIAGDGLKHNWPLQRGFERFYGMISGGGSFYDPFTLCRDNDLISPFADPEYEPENYYFTKAITDHAVRYLDDHAEAHPRDPFFMYVTYTAAHWPMHALPEDIAKTKGRYAWPCGYLYRLRSRLGNGFQHSISRVQALGTRGRYQHATYRSLAQSNRCSRRIPTSARPLDRYHGHVRRRRRCKLSS